MIRHFILSVIVLTSVQSFGQIDYTKLIIGRNTGTKTLHDGTVTDIFGFAETLGETIDIPGPTIYINEGDSVEIDFWNVSQGAPHTIHLHGLDVDQANDGVPSLSYEVHHMDHGYYRFKAPHPGTYIYHCHVVSTIHVQAGMYGVIVVRPSDGTWNQTWTGGEFYDKEFILNTSEIDTNWHTQSVLDHPHDSVNPVPVYVPADYEPQYFLVSGLSDSQLSNASNFLVAGENDKVYLRNVNSGYYGTRFIFPPSISPRTISSDGRPLPSEDTSDTLEVYPGERYGTLVQLGTDPFYTVDIEYFDLNTQVVASTQTVTIKTSMADLEELTNTLPLIYPVPSSSGVFYASSPLSDYQVLDQFGKVILESSGEIIDLSSFSSGVYFLNIQEGVIKLIK